MRLLRESDIIKTNSIAEIKDLMLYRVMLMTGAVGLPVLLYNLYFSITTNVEWSGIINISLILPIILVLLFFRRIKYRLKAYVLVHTVMLLALFNFYIASYAGAAFMLLLSASTFAAAFLEKKEALINIIICILMPIVAAFLFINESWTYNLNFPELNKDPISWSAGIAIYSFLAIMFLFAYNVIQTKLIQKIELEHTQNEILEEANKKYRDLLEKQKQYQEQLIEAKIKAEDSNKLKTEFLHNMSHEVRTPLNGIMGFSRLLKKDDLSDEKRKQFADIVVQSGEKLQRVIDDILEISFLETKQITLDIRRFKVDDFLQDLYLVFNLNTGNSIDIRLKSNNNELFLETDQHKLHKILSNLIENALKFTTKGYVEFGVCDSEKGRVCFYVKDTGIGISPENMEKIFHRFSQEHDDISAKYGGLGLGLCIAKENTTLLGGIIRVESTKTIGTTFYVDIPAKVEQIDPKNSEL
jgi:signal transduction histidine kinase